MEQDVLHYELLENRVNEELTNHGNAIVVDCHSFPNVLLPCDTDQELARPDFCIGTDSFYTPSGPILSCKQKIVNKGYSVQLNKSYKGTLVPFEFYKLEPQVKSIMIEVNSSLYMDENSGIKTASFQNMKRDNNKLFCSIAMF